MLNRYYNAVEDLQKKIRETQAVSMQAAASICAEAIANGHSIHLSDSGHIIDSEMLNRAGGFELVKKFKFNLALDHGHYGPRMQENRENDKDRSLEGVSAFALKAANVYPGDVMFIGSVSGISFGVVDLAVEAKKMGVKIIAITSVEYSKQLESKHPSQKKLYELGDVLIDNCAPFGDAMLKVEGIEKNFIPASGLSAAYIMWAISAMLLEMLLEKGLKPGILGSVNNPENVQFNIELGERYIKKGL